MSTSEFTVFLLKEAEDDIDSVLAYAVEHGSIDGALRILERFREHIEALKTFPLRGNVPKELAGVGRHDYRQLIVTPFRIFYRVIDDQVFVALIADGRRDIAELLHRRLMSD